MSRHAAGPAFVPSYVVTDTVEPSASDWQGRFRSMASDVKVRISPGCAEPEAAFDRVEAIFAAVEFECTRFDPSSDLMRANAAADEWQQVGEYCFAAITAAALAHINTDGLFDPRILRTLCELGYDRSIAFGTESRDLPGRIGDHRPMPAFWAPGLDSATHSVRIGPEPIDLGGIGKGLAVRWAAEELESICPSFIIDAGGDCYLSGGGPAGYGWNVGVEDPRGGADPLAVLTVRNRACATSSIRLRKWTVDGRPVHHLVDPRTTGPGGAGLLAVTVVGRDPADAEVWSKVLFLRGVSEIGRAAEDHGLAAVWVTDDGQVKMSTPADEYVIWQAP